MAIVASRHRPAPALARYAIAANAGNLRRSGPAALRCMNAPQCDDAGISFYFNDLGGFSKAYPQACTQNL
ncbi:hypothetical protein [Herbaspirillum sp. SJZ099]|uniref:hypothetical protein n=1 Tax=Herbaspirillum sp. SJZ099 TaxID=2572916 RepID=UPI0011A2EFD9|nr:hypothetical protein [Herbaspirillum sp. SJZ099]